MENSSGPLVVVTRENLLSINKTLVEKFGGMGHGISNDNQFESLVTGNYNQNVFGVELYPKVEDKISCIVYTIICNHIFLDGNKRTGIYVLKVLAYRFDIDLSSINLVDLAISLGTGLYTINTLSELLQSSGSFKPSMDKVEF